MFEAWWNSDIHLILAVIIHAAFVLLSLALTVHILLHKSDPKASFLWIIFVWLAPFLGAILYLTFGVNRMARPAKKNTCLYENRFHAPTEYEYEGRNAPNGLGPDFHRLGNNITHSHRIQGNLIQIIEGVQLIHETIMLAINTAEQSISLSTYIFKNDDLGKAISNSLIEAKKRGVDVKVLLDGVGNGPFRSHIRRRLKAAGIDVRTFLKGFWPWQLPFLNLRNHRKILIIDGAIAFTGSLNIGRVKNLETHFKLQGAILRQIMRTFHRDWCIAGGQPVTDHVSDKYRFETAGTVIARGIRSGPAYENERLRWILLGALGCAQQEIRILSPYFIPDAGLLSGVKLAALRGVNVEIILPNTSNYPFADWAAMHQMGDLMQAGCHIYRRSDLFDHSKLLTIDGKWALIGSSNWDARSLRLNFEFDVECEDPSFVSELDQIIIERRQKCQPMCFDDFENRSGLKKVRDAAAHLLLPYL